MEHSRLRVACFYEHISSLFIELNLQPLCPHDSTNHPTSLPNESPVQAQPSIFSLIRAEEVTEGVVMEAQTRKSPEEDDILNIGVMEVRDYELGSDHRFVLV